jgi:hypothetical protein
VRVYGPPSSTKQARTTGYHVRLAPWLGSALSELAATEDQNLDEFVMTLLDEALDRRQPKLTGGR